MSWLAVCDAGAARRPSSHRFHPLDPRGARAKLALAIGPGVATWFLLPGALALQVRLLVAWDVGAVVQLLLASFIISSSRPEETGRRAAAYDPGRTAVWFVVLLGCAFSVVGATDVMHASSADVGVGGAALLGLCVGTVLVSWLLTNTAFTLRYAHLFYRTTGKKDGKSGEGGLEFPGGEKPDDLDFAYIAFTIGMCFQVSDVTISARPIRRTVLAHSMLSFAYNTVIIALAMNLVVGHLG